MTRLDRIRAVIAAIVLTISSALSLFNFSAASAVAPDIGPWQTASNALPARPILSNGVANNGYIYILGGLTSQELTPTNTINYALLNSDGSIGTWQSAASTLPAELIGPSSIVGNDYLYVFGGRDYSNGSLVNTAYYAHINSDGTIGTWQSAANLIPENVAGCGVALVNDFVYLHSCLGSDEYASSNVYYAQVNNDGSLDPWETSSNALPDARAVAATTNSDDYLYSVGGLDENGDLTSTVYFAHINTDGSIGTWQASSNSIPENRFGSSGVVFNGYLYVIAGITGPSQFESTYRSSIYYAQLNNDGSVGIWQTSINQLPAVVGGPSIVKGDNGFLYSLGGEYRGEEDNRLYSDAAYYTFLSMGAPTAPTGLAASSPTKASPSLNWNAVPGATSYKIYRNGSVLGTSTTSSFNDTALSSSGSYSYTVSAVNGVGESAQSSAVTVIYDIVKPTVTTPTMSGGINLPLLGFVFLGNTTNISTNVADNLSGVTAAEYYFNNDPGQGNGNALTVSGSTAIASGVNIQGLSGQNTLYVRSLDAAGNWSNTASRTFTRIGL